MYRYYYKKEKKNKNFHPTLVERIETEDAAKIQQNVFGQENLSDCGFNNILLRHFCNPDPAKIEVVEGLKYSNGLYTLS